jgi:hypothetical protein
MAFRVLAFHVLPRFVLTCHVSRSVPVLMVTFLAFCLPHTKSTGAVCTPFLVMAIGPLAERRKQQQQQGRQHQRDDLMKKSFLHDGHDRRKRE